MKRVVNVTFSYRGWLGWCPVVIGRSSEAPDQIAYKARWPILTPWLEFCGQILSILASLYWCVTGNEASDSLKVTRKMNPVITYTYVLTQDESDDEETA